MLFFGYDSNGVTQEALRGKFVESAQHYYSPITLFNWAEKYKEVKGCKSFGGFCVNVGYSLQRYGNSIARIFLRYIDDPIILVSGKNGLELSALIQEIGVVKRNDRYFYIAGFVNKNDKNLVDKIVNASLQYKQADHTSLPSDFTQEGNANNNLFNYHPFTS